MSETPAPAPLEPLREDWERMLCVVAHPDDMEFGAAAAVARWTGQGKWVGYCMVTSGEAGIDGMEPDECRRVREAEEVESARIVGVDNVDFLGQPDGVLEYGVPLRRGDLRLRTPAPARHRRHRQLPRHVGRPEPQPGRPHRHRSGGRRRGARRRQPLGLPRPAHRRARAVGRRRAGLGVRLPAVRPRRRHHGDVRRGCRVAQGARGVHPGPRLGELGRARVPRGHGPRHRPAPRVSRSAAPFEVFPMGWGD